MKILIVGGSGFIGRHLYPFLPKTFQLVSFSRFPEISQSRGVYLKGDRDLGKKDYEALRGLKFDVVIDLSSYYPQQIEDLLKEIESDYYLLVSAVKVYKNRIDRTSLTELADLVDPLWDCRLELDNASYGRFKRACEDLIENRFTDSYCIVRPQVVVGEGDSSKRWKHWFSRASLPGPRLAPGDGLDQLQVLDVLDLSRFIAHCVSQRINGVFHLSGEAVTWERFLDLIEYRDKIWVKARLLQKHGFNFASLPLYRSFDLVNSPFGEACLMNLDSTKAISEGFEVTPIEKTLLRLKSSYQPDKSDLCYDLTRESELLRWLD